MKNLKAKSFIAATVISIGTLTPAAPAHAGKTITEKTIHGCRAEMDDLHPSGSKSTKGYMSVHVRVVCDDALPQKITFQGSMTDLKTKKTAVAPPRSYDQKKQVIYNPIPYRGGKNNFIPCVVGHTYRITATVSVAGKKLDTLASDVLWEEPCPK